MSSQVLAVTTDRALYRFDVFAYQSRTDSTPAETVSVSDRHRLRSLLAGWQRSAACRMIKVIPSRPRRNRVSAKRVYVRIVQRLWLTLAEPEACVKTARYSPNPGRSQCERRHRRRRTRHSQLTWHGCPLVRLAPSCGTAQSPTDVSFLSRADRASSRYNSGFPHDDVAICATSGSPRLPHSQQRHLREGRRTESDHRRQCHPECEKLAHRCVP